MPLDPRDPDVIALPRDTENLAIIAENMHILAFDNLSHIDGDMSDALCRTATGDGFLTRSLYTNRELTVFKGSKPIIMTSITDVAKNADLLDRFLVAKIDKPSKRMTKKKVLTAFKAMHPKVLGAFCFLIREALRNVDNVQVPDDIRMQEPCAFAMAAEKAAGLAEGAIVEAYRYAKRDGQSIVSNEPLVEALLAYLRPEKYVEPVQDISLDDPMDDGSIYLPVAKSASVSSHLKALTRLAYSDTDKPPDDWPKKGRGLRACLDRLIGSLGAFGVTIDFGDRAHRAGQSKDRTWTFHRSFGRVDTSTIHMCPPTCPPHVPTLSGSNCSRFCPVDTLDTSLPDFLPREGERHTSAAHSLGEAAHVSLLAQRKPDPANNVSNVSTPPDRLQLPRDQVDTLGGHVHGHVVQHNVSTPDRDDRDDDEEARQLAFRAVYGHGMYEDESVN